MKHKLISLFLVVCIFCSFAACAKESTGCFIYYPVYDEMTSLDPQVAANDTEKLIVSNCFEGLVRMDENGEIVPAAAESWTISPDGLTYRFNLRADAKWNITNYTSEEMKDLLPENFAPSVTADDFVFAFRRAVDPATGAPDAYLLSSVQEAKNILEGRADTTQLGVRAVSPYQLEIRLDAPQSNFLYVLTECICMPCNRTFFEACGGRYGIMVRHYMSNGPFFLYSFTDEDYTLYASETYNGVHKPTPTKVFLYYNKGGNNVPEKITDEFYSGAYLTDSMFAATEIKRSSTVTELANTTVGLVFNTAHEVLKNANVRKSIAAATDAKQLAAMAEKEYAASLFPAVCNLTPAGLDLFNEQAAAQYLLNGFAELSLPKIVEKQPDPDKKEEDDDKKDPDKQGTVSDGDVSEEGEIGENGQPLISAGPEIEIIEVEEVTSVELTLLTSEQYEDLIKRQMQQWQRILGLRCIIRVETVSEAQLRARVATGDFEMAFCPIAVSSPDSLSFLLQFSAGSPENFIAFADSEYEYLLNSAKTAANELQRQQYIAAAADYLQQSACIIPVFAGSSYLVQTTGVSGMYCNIGPDRVFFNNAFSEN